MLARSISAPKGTISVIRNAIVSVALLLQPSTAGAKMKPPGLKSRASAFAATPADCCRPPVLLAAPANAESRRFLFAPVGYSLFASAGFAGQDAGAKEKKSTRATASTQPRVSLSPRFIPGEAFRYSMEFETTTATSRSGLAADPEGPSKLVIGQSFALLVNF